MISESQERMVAIVEPRRWEAVRAVCERWDLPVAIIGRVTEEPDIVVLTGPDGRGALDADGRPVDGAVELARIPARALASEAIVFERESRAPARRRAAPAPGAPGGARGHPAAPRPGPGRRAPRAARLAEPLVAPPGLRAVRPQRPGQHRRRPGPRRRRAPDQGDDEGARRHDGRQRPGRRARPVAGRRDVRGRGGAQRVDHRRPAAGRHQLPQLRRPHAARGLLAARRGRPRPRRRVRRAGPAGHRRQRLAVQRGAGLGDRARRRRSASWGCWRTSRRASGPAFRARRQRGRCWSARPARASPAASTRASPAPRPRTARRRSTSRASGSLQAFIREAIARGLVESCQDVSGGGLAVALAEMCIWGDRGAQLRLAVGDSPAVALFGESPSRLVVRGARRGTCRRSSCSPASTGCPCDDARRRPAAPRLVIELAGEGATGAAEERGQPDRRRARRRRSRTCGTPGSTGSRGRSGWEGAGADDHAAEAALPGAEVAG